METKVNAFFKNLNLSLTQAEALGYLRRNFGKRSVTQKELEEVLCISHPAISRLFKSLEEKGYVHTYLNPERRTMKIVEATDREYAISKIALQSQVDFENELLQGFSEQERKEFITYLLRAYKNITRKKMAPTSR